MRVEAGGLRALAIERLAVAADRDQPELGAARHRPQSSRDLEAVDPGQPDVDQGDREVAGLRVGQTILAADRGQHLVAVQLEQQAQALARVVVVLDDEDPRRTKRGRRGQLCGRCRRGASGQADDELATEPFSRAERLDRAAMQLDQPPDEGQAEAEAVGARVARSAPSNEQIEDLRQQGGRDPAAGIADAQHRLRAVPLHADVDTAATRGVAERVVQQICDHLLEPRSIPDHPDRVGLQHHLVLGGLAGRLESLERAPGHVRERDRVAFDDDPPGGHARDVEQVVHEAGQVMGLASDDHPDLRGLVVLATQLLEHGHRVADRRQRIPELVGEHREELVLASVPLLDLAIEAAIVEGDGGAARQIANEIDVGGGVAATGIEHGERHRPERGPARGERRDDRPHPAAVLREQGLELVAGDDAQGRVEDLAVHGGAGGRRAEPPLGVDAEPDPLGLGRSGRIGRHDAGQVRHVGEHGAEQIAGDRGALERPGQDARGLGEHAQSDVVGFRGGAGGLLRGQGNSLFGVAARLGVHPRQLHEHPHLGAQDVWQERAEQIVHGAQ